jgi:hypothetical protein
MWELVVSIQNCKGKAMITFEASELRVPVTGKLVYDGTGFTTEPYPYGCALSVTVNELELMVEEGGRWVNFITGYCPHYGWDPAILRPPSTRRAGLRVAYDGELIPGMAIRINPVDERWSVLVDQKSGWVRLGKGDPDEDREGVEFAPGAVAVLEGDRLVALWLHPERLPALTP